MDAEPGTADGYMDQRAALKTFLADQTLAAVETGLWRFREGHYTDRRIPPASLYHFQQGWCELAADEILAAPTGGLLGFAYQPGVQWLRALAAVLERRGAELPVTEVGTRTLPSWGVPLGQYPRGASLTAFVDVHTLGAHARELRFVAEAAGVRLGRVVALVDRHPTPTRQADGVPFASVVHLPLPLYRTAADVPEPVRRARQAGPWAGWGVLRGQGGPLVS
jgi:hypothetical protein